MVYCDISPLKCLHLRLSGLLTARFILRLRAYHGRGTPDDSAHATSAVSTFEVAAGGDQQNSRTAFDEFGVDPLQVASRKSDEAKGEYAAHGLRFAINRGPGWDTDIDQTATFVGSDLESLVGAASSVYQGRPEFLEGSSGRRKDEFVEGSSSDLV